MLTAEQARIKSAASKTEYHKYLVDILVWIEQHADIGLSEFITPMKNTFPVDLSRNQDALNYLITELELLGYIVSYDKNTTRLVVDWE